MGFNCLVGFGDSGKFSIFDVIDFCLGVWCSVLFGDIDFYRLDVIYFILIIVMLGGFFDDLINLDSYGDFLCGYDFVNGVLEDEL